MEILLQGVSNARQLGGIVTKYGTIKYNKLIRSGALTQATAEDVQTLLKCDLHQIVDLRTKAEMENCPDVQIDGVTVENVPILHATTFGISYDTLDGKTIAEMLNRGIARMQQRNETPIKHMQLLYKNFVVSNHSKQMYGQFISVLSKPSTGATLWHCSAGKDRCGTCTAILLYCLGASKKQIMRDYLLTNKQTAKNNVSILAKVTPFVSKQTLKLVKKMLTVDRSYLQAFFKQIKRTYKTMDNFVAECGITATQIQSLKDNYLDK